MTQPIAYVSPFTNTTNRYIELQKQILRNCGYTVLPLSIKAIVTGQAWGLFNRRNIACFHWLETRAYKWQNGKAGLSLLGLVQVLFYFSLMHVSRARIVYFVHDHSVHDTAGWRKSFSVRLIQLIRAAADDRVVHDPSFCDSYRASYLPHPLYWDDGRSHTPPPSVQIETSATKFGLLGAVRPYKCIDEILEVWPRDRSLLIRGRATADYEQLLRAIIKRRGLEDCVDFLSGHVSDDQFNECMQSIDVLILPHRADSMLVSGAFFEGVGRVQTILVRRNPFFEWVRHHVVNVLPFDAISEFTATVESCRPSERSTSSAQEQAVRQFGFARCLSDYGNFYRKQHHAQANVND